MWLDKDALGVVRSIGFRAPAGMPAEKQEVLFPFGEKKEPAFAAVLAVTIKQMDTILQPGALTADMTINLTLDAQLSIGARLHVKLKEAANAANRTVTLGTGFDADASDVVVTQNTSEFRTFIFDGVAFTPAYQ
jgi:hypothetical protein